MQDPALLVQEYLDDFRKGRTDKAFDGLTEQAHDVLPELISVFKKEPDPEVRDFLVEVIWQHRQPWVIPFLGEALHDPDKKVWKQALNGLVTLASPEALEALKSARGRHFKRERDAEDFRSWIDEAIEQVLAEYGK